MTPESLHKHMRDTGLSAFEVALKAINENEWRGIESAPKDGTEVLLAGGENNLIQRVGWRWSNDDMWIIWSDFDNEYTNFGFTHWKPTTSPPEK